jgi:hypothetical protein
MSFKVNCSQKGIQNGSFELDKIAIPEPKRNRRKRENIKDVRINGVNINSNTCTFDNMKQHSNVTKPPTNSDYQSKEVHLLMILSIQCSFPFHQNTLWHTR